MALFVLTVVGIIVGQTWLDWRAANQSAVVPDWAKGTALAGVIAVSLAAVSSFASAWIQDPANERAIDFGSRMFWPEFVFLCGALGIVVFTVHKKRMRLLVVLGSVLLLAFWLGITLS